MNDKNYILITENVTPALLLTPKTHASSVKLRMADIISSRFSEIMVGCDDIPHSTKHNKKKPKHLQKPSNTIKIQNQKKGKPYEPERIFMNNDQRNKKMYEQNAKKLGKYLEGLPHDKEEDILFGLKLSAVAAKEYNDEYEKAVKSAEKMNQKINQSEHILGNYYQFREHLNDIKITQTRFPSTRPMTTEKYTETTRRLIKKHESFFDRLRIPPHKIKQHQSPEFIKDRLNWLSKKLHEVEKQKDLLETKLSPRTSKPAISFVTPTPSPRNYPTKPRVIKTSEKILKQESINSENAQHFRTGSFITRMLSSSDLCMPLQKSLFTPRTGVNTPSIASKDLDNFEKKYEECYSLLKFPIKNSPTKISNASVNRTSIPTKKKVKILGGCHNYTRYLSP